LLIGIILIDFMMRTSNADTQTLAGSY